MKKLVNLKLNHLSQIDLTEQEMNILRGGGTPGNCVCNCGWENTPYGSTSSANGSSNDSYGYTQSYGGGNGGYSSPNTEYNGICNTTLMINSNDVPCEGMGTPNCNSEPNKC